MGIIIGIDLGTTTSEIAYMKEGKPEIILNLQENNSGIIPSIVVIEEGEIKVGEKAKNLAILKAENTVCEVKRKMGTGEKIALKSSEYLPEEISAMILKRIKEIAEFNLGEEVNSAVITVPANFNEVARRATRDAGEIAGLKVERIINEPTAAAMAYGINNKKNGYILVYDLGGGTLDVSVLELFNGVLDVKASRGNNYLGGKDIDEALLNLIVDKFYKDSDIKLDLGKARILTSLKNAAEEAKKNLSFESVTEVIIPYIAVDSSNNPVDLNIEITRGEFEGEIANIIESTQDIINEALNATKLQDSNIDYVILVGGSTRIPYVRNMINNRFQGKIVSGVHPDEAVALGAAVQAGIMSGLVSSEESLVVTDSCSHTLGVEVLYGGFDAIIKRDSKLPASITKGYHTVEDNQDIVEIKVYEGESTLAKNNNFIGSFELGNIPLAPRGEERIDITFEYDLNGILDVSAKIISTGEIASKRIIMKGLSENEIVELQNNLRNNNGKNVISKDSDKEVEKVGNILKEEVIEEEKTSEKVKNQIIEEKSNEKVGEVTDEQISEVDDEISTPEELYQYVGQLVNYYNSIANTLDESTKKTANEKLQDLLATVKNNNVKLGEKLCNEIIALIYKE